MKLLGVILLLTALTAHAQTTNERACFDLVNEQRAAAGIRLLDWSDQLYAAAKAHSDDEAAHLGQCPAHDSCNGEAWYKRVGRYYPNWVFLGENFAPSLEDPHFVVDGWMNSPGHRANILNWNFFDGACAMSDSLTPANGRWWWATFDFGWNGFIPSGTPTPTPRGTPTPTPSARADGIEGLRITHAGTKTKPKTVVTGLVVMPAGADLRQDAALTIDRLVLSFPAGCLADLGQRGVQSTCAPVVFRLVPAMRTLYRFRAEIPGRLDATTVKLQAAGKEWTS